jgi:hypothetical protein
LVFAREAHGRCPIYERLSQGVAETSDLLNFLATLPPERRQPNLFFAAVRHLHGVADDTDRLIEIVTRDSGNIRALMLSRTTQTNEPARCAILLPLLARLPQPLALLEVGASAGLCLLPDRYGYDYGTVRIDPPATGGPAPPVFACAVSGPVPLPSRLPEVAWRRGLDLNPIDLCHDEEVAWLETLVWPGQDNRLAKLRSAIAAARGDPPPLVRGDLLTDLPALIAAAPKDATLVVFHTAVLTYITTREEREHFADAMLAATAVWISNEVPRVFPRLSANTPPPPDPNSFLLMQDGRPLAWAGPHGQSLAWFGRA